MIIRYCDICGAKMLNAANRLEGEFESMKFVVITGKRGDTWNQGDFCNNCIRAAVAATAEETENGT